MVTDQSRELLEAHIRMAVELGSSDVDSFARLRKHRDQPGKLPVMAQPDDLEARVAALETQVRDLAERVRHSEQDAAAARVLAGGADRDVAEIREEIRDFRQATTSSFNAMRADLTDLRTRVGDGFAQVDRGFAEMRGKLDATAAGQQQIVHLLNTLIAEQGGQPNGQ